MNSFKFLRTGWFQFLVGGAVLFFAAEQTLKFTGNPNYFPTVILLGALVVPVAFVAYFYRQERLLDASFQRESPLTLVALCFIVGGVVGVIIAGLLEFETLVKIGYGGLLAVAVIEEAAKLIFPVILFIKGQYRSEIDGLLFGAASGMGFAALETMGYGLVALIQSQGSVGTLQQVLLIRGLLSPVGHAAWTGLICATLWRRRELSGKLFHPAVIGAYAVAVILHTLWDVAGSSNIAFVAYAGYIIVGAISLTLLIRRLKEARRLKSRKLADEQI